MKTLEIFPGIGERLADTNCTEDSSLESLTRLIVGDVPTLSVYCGGRFVPRSGRSGTNITRMGLDFYDVHDVWLSAYGNHECGAESTSMYDKLRRDWLESIHMYYSVFEPAARVPLKYLNPQQLYQASEVFSILVYYSYFEPGEYLQVLVCVLSVFLDSVEAVHLLVALSQRIKARSSHRLFLWRSESQFEQFFEGSLAELVKRVPRLSESAVNSFRTFLATGGSSSGNMPLLVRICGSFLFEGCKVFTRYAIAYIQLGLLDKELSITDVSSLSTRAFGLRIRSRKLPPAVEPPNYVHAPQSSFCPGVLRMPVSSKIGSLAPLVSSHCTELGLRVETLVGRSVSLVHSSTEGRSSSVFESKVSSIGGRLTVALFQTPTACVSVSVTEGIACIFAGESVAMHPRRVREKWLERAGGMLVCRDWAEGEILLSFSVDFTHITVGSVDFEFEDFQVFNII